MFEKFSIALLLATGATANTHPEICCSFFEQVNFRGTHANLCIASTDSEEDFDVT